MKMHTRTCPQCGAIFSRRQLNGKLAFCSCACRAHFYKCGGAHNVKGANVPCAHCGKPFWQVPVYVRKGGGKFCSHECYVKHRTKERPKIACQRCGKDIFSNLSYYIDVTNLRQRRFCSLSCARSTRGGITTDDRVARDLRLAALLNADGEWSKKDVDRLYAVQRGQCAYCHRSLEDGYHIDHIMPLSKGGSNWPRNLQLLCPTCNVRKSAMHPEAFARKIGLLL
jgi:5-methylcytosine-specific restriction endonuclease McrA